MDCLIPCIMSRIHKCFITIIIISVIIKPSPAPPRPAPPACLTQPCMPCITTR